MGENLAKEISENHCQSCGACCAYYRVLFYWREAETTQTNPVPIQHTQDVNPFQRCMKGTDEKHRPHCVCLTGRIGKHVGCSIYLNRPTPCREFSPSYADGKPNKRCDLARKAHGLKPLTPSDWPAPRNNSTENVD